MTESAHYPAEIHTILTADRTLRIGLGGDWVRGTNLPEAEKTLKEIGAARHYRRVEFEAAGLKRWDSRVLTFLIKLIDHCKASGAEVDLTGLPEGVQGLLTLAYAVPERSGAKRRSVPAPLLARLGNWVLGGARDGKALIEFIGQMLLSCAGLMTGKARFRLIDLTLNIQDCGPAALPIVTVISLLVGLILAFVGAVQLALFGAQLYIADLVGLGMVREMGALMTAIIMSGRTGAAYAAQLGTMNVNSEIDALQTMGISPMDFLVLPRMLALILVMPLLCLYSDVMGIIGGAVVTVSFFDVSLIQYLDETKSSVHLHDFAVGIFKCAVFGVLIAVAGCMRGMQCGRSASAVGDAATSAVVTGIVFIVVSDAIITLIFNRLDI